ncbi:MAG: hypothetical protein WD824_18240, partial [Cyclobacteriaceae bacterium]
MRKLILYVLTIISFVTYGQGTEERVLYVVDSIPIVNDPGEEDGTLTIAIRFAKDFDLISVVKKI